jgi:DivIVA domain-containing protein
MPTLQPRRDLPDMSAEMIAARRFGQSWRGYDQEEVKQFLADVANQMRALRERAETAESGRREAEARAAHPRLDEATLTSALGEETADILRSAHNAAAEVLAKAEAISQQVAAEADSRAKELVAQAESLLAERTAEADQAAQELVQQAQAEADETRSEAEEQAMALGGEAQRKHDEMVQSAEATRERVLGDLARRRRLATVQIEQLRAGRERLLAAYLTVRRTLDEVTDELQRADAEARGAAEAVGRQHTGEVAELGASQAEDVWEATGHVGDDVPTGGALGIVLAPKAGELAAASEGKAGSGPDRERPATEQRSGTGRGPAETPRPEPAPSGNWDAHGPGRRGALVAPAAEFESVRILRPVEETGATEAEVRPARDSSPEVAPQLGPATAEIPLAGTYPAPSPNRPQTAVAENEEAPGADNAGRPDETGTSGAATGEQPALSPGGPDVEDLFARIRAGRAEATTKARRTLEASNGRRGPGEQAEEDAGEVPETPPGGIPVTQASPEEDNSYFARRDLVTGRLEASLARKLKRALQDEQNALLDRLRSLKGRPNAESVLPSAEEQPDRFVDAGRPLLEEAAKEGIELVAKTCAAGAASTELRTEVVEDLADELGKAIAEPLRQRLEQALSSGGEASELADAFGAAYREWKTQRIESTAHDQVAAAFARGAYLALPENSDLRWVVDAAEGPCPDCEDNALAKGQKKGEPWPTGQLHPPAHPGCRCALAPEPLEKETPANATDRGRAGSGGAPTA